MKKGSNVQRSLLRPWLGTSIATRSLGSLRPLSVSLSVAVTLAGLSAGCSGTIEGAGPRPGDGAGNGNTNTPNGGNGQGVGGAGSGSNGGAGNQPQGGNGNGNGNAGNGNGNNNAGSGNGNGSGGSGNGSGSGGAPGEAIPSALPTPSACNPGGSSPGPRLLRRLSASEFNASIRDLFDDPTAPVAPVFNDQRVLGFSVDSNALVVQGLNADQLMNNAETVAAWAVKNKLSRIASCSTLDANCGKSFLKSFLSRAFRKTLADGDANIDNYNKLFLAETNFTDGVTSVVSAVLQSPNFLYRTELGETATGNVTLTPYEVASSLSYLLVGSMPDPTLMQAADQVKNNSLQLSAMVDQQAQRLLGTPKAQDAVMDFMGGWLGLDRLYSMVKDDNVLKLTDAQRDDMAAETRAFILDVFSGSNGKTGVGDLFKTNRFFLNKNLASYYGLSQDGLSTNVQKVEYTSAPQRDGGLLAQASLLVGYARADLSSPTQRGHLVRSRLLCQDVPPPPAGLDTKFQPATNAKTTRDHYLQEHASPNRSECYGCHKLMDPIGVAFEHYDSFGRYRTQENGVNIDSTGTIYSASVKDGDVAIDGLSGAKGMQEYLASSDAVKSCLVRYWSYYAFGSASWSQDQCTYSAVESEASSKSYALKSVLMAIIHSPRFTTRAGQ